MWAQPPCGARRCVGFNGSMCLCSYRSLMTPNNPRSAFRLARHPERLWHIEHRTDKARTTHAWRWEPVTEGKYPHHKGRSSTADNRSTKHVVKPTHECHQARAGSGHARICAKGPKPREGAESQARSRAHTLMDSMASSSETTSHAPPRPLRTTKPPQLSPAAVASPRLPLLREVAGTSSSSPLSYPSPPTRVP